MSAIENIEWINILIHNRYSTLHSITLSPNSNTRSLNPLGSRSHVHIVRLPTTIAHSINQWDPLASDLAIATISLKPIASNHNTMI